MPSSRPKLSLSESVENLVFGFFLCLLAGIAPSAAVVWPNLLQAKVAKQLFKAHMSILKFISAFKFEDKLKRIGNRLLPVGMCQAILARIYCNVFVRFLFVIALLIGKTLPIEPVLGDLYWVLRSAQSWKWLQQSLQNQVREDKDGCLSEARYLPTRIAAALAWAYLRRYKDG